MSDLKADGNWGVVASSEFTLPDDEDPIQQAISALEQMRLNNAPEEAITKQEKRIWDMIYRKRMLS